MITSVEFLAEYRYDNLIIQSPNSIEPRWRSELQVDGNMYAGYGENGHIALCAAIQRFRETDPESPGVETMTINIDRELIDERNGLT